MNSNPCLIAQTHEAKLRMEGRELNSAPDFRLGSVARRGVQNKQAGRLKVIMSVGWRGGSWGKAIRGCM